MKRNFKEKYRRKQKRKSPRNDQETATLKIRVAGFPPKRPLFRLFSRFAMIGPCDFLKIWFLRHDIRRSSSTSRIRHRNHLIIIGHSEIVNRPTKKAHFLPDRSWNRLDRCCWPIGVNQSLNLHRHPTSNNMQIHRWSSQEEFQKTRCGPRLFERPGDHLMQLNDPFYDKLMRSLTHYFGRPIRSEEKGVTSPSSYGNKSCNSPRHGV